MVMKKIASIVMVLICTSIFMESCEYNKSLELFEVPDKSFEIINLKMASNNFKENYRFYSQTLGLTTSYNADSTAFTVSFPNNSITFYNTGINDTLGVFPQYQFTISVPSNQIEGCYQWLTQPDTNNPDKVRERVKLWYDSETGAEIFRRENYNSQSIYIKDASKNVVEILARHDANVTLPGAFNRGMFQGISEVGVLSRDLRKSAEDLKAAFGVSEVTGSSNSYKPVGGPTGLIKLNIEGKIWTPTDNEVVRDHKLVVTVRGSETIAPIQFSRFGILDTTNFGLLDGVWLLAKP
jgi:hypothetical protein